jgi:hypothetical protein
MMARIENLGRHETRSHEIFWVSFVGLHVGLVD